MNNRFRFRLIKFAVPLLVVLFILPGCAALKPDIEFVDRLPAGTPKGYIELFSPNLLGVLMYCEEDRQKEQISSFPFPRPGGKGVRFAKAPGEYTFLVVHGNFRKKIKVKVVKDALVYVSAYQDVITSRTNVDSRGGMTMYTAYYVDLVVGTHAIPLSQDAGSVPLLVAALSDVNPRTRLHAIEALSKMDITRNATVLTALNEVAVFDLHIDVRKAAKTVLQQKGSEPHWPEKAALLGGRNAAYRGWNVKKDATGVSSFEAGKYTVESITPECTWNAISPGIAPPKNYDLELVSTWKSGAQDKEYGLIIGNNKKFYSFGAVCTKQADIQLFKDDELKTDVLPWKPATVLCQGAGKGTNKQRIEVRGETITYYVNDVLVGTTNDELGGDDRFFGVRVCGKQKVAFDEMSIQPK